jgi:hypothetical protein
MRLTSARKIQTIFRNYWVLRIPAALFFVAGLTGCNTCVTFTSPNGSLGIVSSDPRPACTLPKVMSAVRVHMAASPPCNSCAGSSQVQHIFVAIQSIELNPSASARDDSPDWQEVLLPEIEQRPLQIDLLESNAKRNAVELSGGTALIPAGIYRQLRLRFVPNQPAADVELPQKNMCGSGTFNCVVMADGGIHPLQLNADSSELRIMPDKMDGAALPIVSDAGTDLIIEMKIMWEWSSSADKGIRLLPALFSSAKVRRINWDELGTLEGGAGDDSHSRQALD